MAAALDAALSSDTEAAGRAGDVLRRFVREYRSPGGPGCDQTTPGHGTYALIDGLIRHAAGPGAKAELLLDLLDACEDDSPFSAPAALVTNVLLCYPEAAMGHLVEWFRGVSSKDGLYDAAWRLFALCRTGTPFCREVVDHSASLDAARQVVGLAGTEAMGRCLDVQWMREAKPEAFAFEVRFREVAAAAQRGPGPGHPGPDRRAGSGPAGSPAGGGPQRCAGGPWADADG